MDSRIGWSSGVKFELLDASKSYNLFSLGLDIGGYMRNSDDFKLSDTKEKLSKKYSKEFAKNIENAGFKGLGIRIESHALKGIMGKKYMNLWLGTRFEFNDPGKFGMTDVNREDTLTYFGFGLEQRLVDVSNANLKLTAKVEATPSMSYSIKDAASGKKMYYSGVDLKTLNDYDGNAVADKPDMKVFINLGLEGSFTSVFTKMVK